MLDHIQDLLRTYVRKGLLEFAYVHRLLWEYVQVLVQGAAQAASGVSTPLESAKYQSRIAFFVDLLADAAPKLMSTKPGAKSMCYLISYAAVKERKRILKALKGHVLELLLHDAAYLSIMRLIDVTDDTVAVQKAVFDEVRSTAPVTKYTATGELIGTPLPPLASIALHKCGHKLLLRLLAPHSKHLEPDELDLFADVHMRNSKKDRDLKRKQNLAYLKNALVTVCTNHADNLLRSRSGARVLEEVIRVLHPASVIQSMVSVVTCSEAVAMEVDGPVVEEEDNDDEEESEEANEEEEGEGEDGDEGEEQEEEEEEGQEELEDMQEAEAEIQEDLKALAKGNAASQEKEAPQLPIEEDPSTHALLKRLLHFEAIYEKAHSEPKESKTPKKGSETPKKGSKKQKQPKVQEAVEELLRMSNAKEEAAVTAVDESLWSDPHLSEDGAHCSISHLLATALQEREDLVDQWLQKNRPSLVLLKLLSVQSVFKDVLALLLRHVEENTGALQSHEAGKALLKVVEVASQL